METIEFRILEEQFPTGLHPSIAPFLSGVPLADLLREVELPAARRRGDLSLAGWYAGLTGTGIRWPSRYYLGEPATGSGTVLLGCTCGEAGCWPFSAVVRVEDDTVTWSDYHHGFLDADHRELRPFTFDRRQYEDAVRATAD